MLLVYMRGYMRGSTVALKREGKLCQEEELHVNSRKSIIKQILHSLVIFDFKLMYKSHLDNMTNEVISAIRVCGGMFGKFGG